MEDILHPFSADLIPAAKMVRDEGGTMADMHYVFAVDGAFRAYFTTAPDVDISSGRWTGENGEYSFDNPVTAEMPEWMAVDYRRLTEENGRMIIDLCVMKLYLKRTGVRRRKKT